MLYTSGRLEVLGNQFVIAFEWADISGLSVLCVTGNFATRTFSTAARGWREGVAGVGVGWSEFCNSRSCDFEIHSIILETHAKHEHNLKFSRG